MPNFATLHSSHPTPHRRRRSSFDSINLASSSSSSSAISHPSIDRSTMHQRSLLFAFFFFSLCLLLQTPRAAALDHPVAWSVNANFDTTGQTFSVGDTITFSWSGGHTVAVVSESSYAACAASSSDTVYTKSPAKIKLTAPGTVYFICTVPGHCAGGGMKFSAAVASSNSSTPADSSSSSAGDAATFSGAPLLIALLFSLLGF